MINPKELFEQRIKSFNDTFFDSFDYDFSTVTENINTLDEFNKKIATDFESGKRLFYRGERINDSSRRLIPTMLRNPKKLLERGDYGMLHIDAEYLFNYYCSMGDFVSLYDKTMGNANVNNLYELTAFAQHYCEFSPLIDFTKSLYPALSFALKDRKEYNNDIVLYVLELKHEKDYTKNIVVANNWMRNLNVYLNYFDEDTIKNVIQDSFELKYPLLPRDAKEAKEQLEMLNLPSSPTAKLIDVPTNTRMKFQQGVFLLLTDFYLVKSNYFTKNIRDNFVITKYVISKNICPKLMNYINDKAPWYSYKYLCDEDGAFKQAINKSQD